MISRFHSPYNSHYFHLFEEIDISKRCSKIKEPPCNNPCKNPCKSNLCSNYEVKPSFILGGLSVFEYEKTLSKNQLRLLKYSNNWNLSLEDKELSRYSIGISIDSGEVLLLPLYAAEYTLGITSLGKRSFLYKLNDLLIASIEAGNKDAAKVAIDHFLKCIEEEKEMIEVFQEYEIRKKEFEIFQLETAEKINQKRKQERQEKGEK